MGWTKRQFVERAFREIGVFGGFDLDPDMLIAAGNDLDAMMAMWNARGLRLGYPLSSPSSFNIDEDTHLTDEATEAVYKNLAVRIAPTIGRQVQPETKLTARAAYMALLALSTQPPEMRLPTTLPAGAGNKPWRWDNPFILQEQPDIDAGTDVIL
jgi:hypothetical protein